MKKFLSIVLVILMIFSLTACTSGVNKEIKSVINEFNDAVKQYDIESMTKLVDTFPSVNKKTYGYDIFNDKNFVVLYKIANKDLKIKIEKIAVNQDSATASINVKSYNLQRLFEDTMNKYLGQTLSDEKIISDLTSGKISTPQLIAQIMSEKIKSGSVLKGSFNVKLSLKKVNDKWIIVNDSNLKLYISSTLSNYEIPQKNITFAEDKQIDVEFEAKDNDEQTNNATNDNQTTQNNNQTQNEQNNTQNNNNSNNNNNGNNNNNNTGNNNDDNGNGNGNQNGGESNDNNTWNGESDFDSGEI